MARDTNFDEVLEMVRKLSPAEKRRLIEQVALETEQSTAKPDSPRSRSLLGLVKDLGPAPSAEEIDEARREAWRNFPREDI